MRLQIRLMLIVTFLVFVTVAVAQPKPQIPQQKEKLLKQLTEKLQLTDAQIKKVESILKDTQKKMDEFQPGNDNDGPPPMEKMDEIIKKQDNEIEKILTDEQKIVFAKMRKERQNRRPPMNGEIPGPPRN